jgi:hypothetical protein
LTEEEKAAIANGEDLYVGLITDGAPVQPMYLQVGPEGWLQESMTAYLCPACHAEFITIDETVDHIRAQLCDMNKPTSDALKLL